MMKCEHDWVRTIERALDDVQVDILHLPEGRWILSALCIISGCGRGIVVSQEDLNQLTIEEGFELFEEDGEKRNGLRGIVVRVDGRLFGDDGREEGVES